MEWKDGSTVKGTIALTKDPSPSEATTHVEYYTATCYIRFRALDTLFQSPPVMHAYVQTPTSIYIYTHTNTHFFILKKKKHGRAFYLTPVPFTTLRNSTVIPQCYLIFRYIPNIPTDS